MTLYFRVSDQNLSADELDALVRKLPADAAGEGLALDLLEGTRSPGGGANHRGDPITIGAFALGLVTSGTIVALFNLLKSYVERSDELAVEFEKKDGSPVKLQMKNITLEKFKGVIRELGKDDG